MAIPKKVIILGGGLAGLAAAVTLADHDFQVVLVERKPVLGGRASSYLLPQSKILNKVPTVYQASVQQDVPSLADQSGHETFVDNCQHVLMKCCTNLLDFYHRISAEQGITFFDHYVFLDRQGGVSMLKGSRWPAPFHLLPSFLTFKLLSWRDRLAVGYALFRMLLEQNRLEQLDQVSMLDWLLKHGQTSRTIEIFWRTILVSALNEDLEVASAKYGIKVFTEALLKNSTGFHIGIPSVPLRELYTEPCLRVLKARGGEVRLRATVTKIEVVDSRVAGVLLGDGTKLVGDYYLSGLPPTVLLRLLPETLVNQSQYFSKLRLFHFSPITSICFWFDQSITDLEYLALVDRKIQWIFSKKISLQGSSDKGYLALVVSASRNLLHLRKEKIVEIALRDLHEVMPSSKSATLLKSVVIKEPAATFSCRVGCDANRLDHQSPLENLIVAGDWTRTGWPPTMEGAVRSSYRCAEIILKAEGNPTSLLQPNLPAGCLTRWFWKSPSGEFG